MRLRPGHPVPKPSPNAYLEYQGRESVEVMPFASEVTATSDHWEILPRLGARPPQS